MLLARTLYLKALIHHTHLLCYSSSHLRVMGSSKLNLFTIVAGLAFSTAVPLTSPVPGHQLLSRQASAALCGVFSDDGTPVATTIDETKCPQLHYTNLGYCYDSGEGPNVEAAIKAAGDLALAAREFVGSMASRSYRLIKRSPSNVQPQRCQ